MLYKTITAVAFFAITIVVGCTDATVQLDPDGKPLPRLYRISDDDTQTIQFRMLDGVNAVRVSRGRSTLVFNSELMAAALTHSRDMSLQDRPWHFGSDGSSPLDRAAQVGYPGLLLGEVISETYETELETLAGWMSDPETSAVLLDPRAEDAGFAWSQEKDGRLWWTMVVGTQQIEPPNIGANMPVDTTRQVVNGDLVE